MDQQHLMSYVQQLTNVRAQLEYQIIQLQAKIKELEKTSEKPTEKAPEEATQAAAA